MEYRVLGNSQLRVSELALGTWQHVNRADQATADRLVGTALDLGINFFDTADSYADAPEALGHALRGRARDSYLISSKVYYPGNGQAGGLSRRNIVASTEASLTRLSVECVDLLSAHRFDATVPLEETLGAFGHLVSAGKIRYYGVSEWTAEQIEAACQLAAGLGIPPPVCDQPQYSVVWRVPEKRVMPACERLGLGLVVFWPLAQGALTGKYRVGVAPPPGTRASSPSGSLTMAHVMNDALLARVELFERVARRRGLTAAQLAIAWVLSRRGVTSALVGASTVEQLAENAAASGAVLDCRTLDLIDKIFSGCVLDEARAAD